jgi:tRNA(adenine34) deaminase
MSQPGNAAISAHFQPWNRQSNTSAKFSTSNDIDSGENLMASSTTKSSRWVGKVKTDSTHPAKGLFTKSPETIARELASKRVSPKGPVSGMRMLTYFINRAGKGLSASRRAALEKAKELLSQRIHAQRVDGAHSAPRKSHA